MKLVDTYITSVLSNINGCCAVVWAIAVCAYLRTTSSSPASQPSSSDCSAMWLDTELWLCNYFRWLVERKTKLDEEKPNTHTQSPCTKTHSMWASARSQRTKPNAHFIINDYSEKQQRKEAKFRQTCHRWEEKNAINFAHFISLSLGCKILLGVNEY